MHGCQGGGELACETDIILTVPSILEQHTPGKEKKYDKFGEV